MAKEKKAVAKAVKAPKVKEASAEKKPRKAKAESAKVAELRERVFDILQRVKSTEKWKRGEILAECDRRTSSESLARILKKLKAEGKISMQGEKSTAAYSIV